jgi:hypothetical protein
VRVLSDSGGVVITVRPERRRTVKSRTRWLRAWKATVRHLGDELEVSAGRGCWERGLNAAGETVVERQWNASRRLVVNVGDRIVADDSVLEVIGVTAIGWQETWRCVSVEGSAKCGEVIVMPMARNSRPHLQRAGGLNVMKRGASQ